MSDLIVADDEYASLASAYREWGGKCEDLLDSYTTCLGMILDNAIIEGQVAQNLSSFAASAKLLGGQFQEAVDEAASLCEGFVTDIDVADDFVY